MIPMTAKVHAPAVANRESSRLTHTPGLYPRVGTI